MRYDGREKKNLQEDNVPIGLTESGRGTFRVEWRQSHLFVQETPLEYAFVARVARVHLSVFQCVPVDLTYDRHGK